MFNSAQSPLFCTYRGLRWVRVKEGSPQDIVKLSFTHSIICLAFISEPLIEHLFYAMYCAGDTKINEVTVIEELTFWGQRYSRWL